MENTGKNIYGEIVTFSHHYKGWTVHSHDKTIWIDNWEKRNPKNRLIVWGGEILEKLIFDPEKKTIEAVVSRVEKENTPRKVDLSEVPELFDEIRDGIEEVITFKPEDSHTTPLYYESVTPNEDRTVFEVK